MTACEGSHEILHEETIRETDERSQNVTNLHLNRVSLLQRLVQDTGRVDHLERFIGRETWSDGFLILRILPYLPSEELVVEVADVERLRRERVRLHLDVGSEVHGIVRLKELHNSMK